MIKVLFGLISLIIQQIIKGITKQLEKKFGNKPKEKLMALFVLLEQEELLRVLAMH